MEILITAGGTEEPIDGVRTINNFSTGRTGATIADIFSQAGFKVTLLTSLKGVSPLEDIDIIRYQSFDDLDNELKNLLSIRNYVGVIHSAAVSDYTVDYLESDNKKFKPDKNIKLDSTKKLKIILKPTFKIIEKIKTYANGPLILVGFKLTKNASESLIEEKVKNVLNGKKVDYVIHNDLTSITDISHISTLYNRSEIIGNYKTKSEMAQALLKIFKEKK